MNNRKINMIFVVIQGLFTLITLVSVIVYFFHPKIKVFLPFFFGGTLLTLALNNYRIYQKKKFTFIYLIFGLICIICGIMGV